MKLCKRLLSALCAAALLFSFSASAMAANQTEETEQTDPAGQADQTEQNSEEQRARQQYENLVAVADLIRQVGVESSPDDDPLARGLAALFEKDPTAYEALMSAMLGSYDRYTSYVPAGHYETSYPTSGSYVGVGVTLEQYGDDVRVAAVTEGGSAQKAGILPGDLIVSAGGKNTRGMTIEEVSSLLRGDEGTTVTVGVQRAGGGATFVLQRAAIAVSNFSSQVLEDGIYYMQWTRFAESSSYIQFVFAIQEMVEKQSKVLILDLRGNPGGEVDMALNALNRLIPDKGKSYFAVSSRQGAQKDIQVMESDGMGPRLNQILILTDGGSASASEIMISSLHDLGYAQTVGTTTYGKARGQYHLVFDDGSAVIITGLELIAPSTPDYDGVGLKPDHEVENQVQPHPAALCEKVPERVLNLTNWSEDTLKLNQALAALGLLDQDAKQDMHEFDQLTLEALNQFRGYAGLAPQNYLDAQTAALINQRLEQFKDQQTLADKQLDYALKLARTYLSQPLQYTVDEYGNFENIPLPAEEPPAEEPAA